MANSTGYTMTLREGDTVLKTAQVTALQYEITEPESGTFTASVTAQGDGTNYRDSDPKTVNCVYTREQEIEINDDKYDTFGALHASLMDVVPGIIGQNLTEQQQKQKSDEMKAAFVDGFSRDEYSEFIPFSSKELERGFTTAEYKFPQSWASSYSPGIITVAGLIDNPGFMARETIHETGHHFGLGEALTELLVAKYTNADISVNGLDANFINSAYSPYYDNVLLERVGDEKFWNTVFHSSGQNPNAEYGKMWDENMTVTVDGRKELLVNHHDMQSARALNTIALYRQNNEQFEKIASEFEKALGTKDLIAEFGKMGPVFDNAIKNNNPTAIKQIQDFMALAHESEKKH
ncbi:MAG: hypothetical protein FWG02_06695, partial [Holophagaceae bacterium]|nr:hypothetical protein [Holophagaceae bacterium]